MSEYSVTLNSCEYDYLAQKKQNDFTFPTKPRITGSVIFSSSMLTHINIFSSTIWSHMVWYTICANCCSKVFSNSNGLIIRRASKIWNQSWISINGSVNYKFPTYQFVIPIYMSYVVWVGHCIYPPSDSTFTSFFNTNRVNTMDARSESTPRDTNTFGHKISAYHNFSIIWMLFLNPSD